MVYAVNSLTYGSNKKMSRFNAAKKQKYSGNLEMLTEYESIKKKHKDEINAFRNKWKVNKRTAHREMKGQWSRVIETIKEIKREMMYEQEETCAICGEEFGYKKEPHLDHCHTTGQLREVLCEQCNKGLGFFKDQTALFEKAWSYIKKHQELYKAGQYQMYPK